MVYENVIKNQVTLQLTATHLLSASNNLHNYTTNNFTAKKLSDLSLLLHEVHKVSRSNINMNDGSAVLNDGLQHLTKVATNYAMTRSHCCLSFTGWRLVSNFWQLMCRYLGKKNSNVRYRHQCLPLWSLLYFLHLLCQDSRILLRKTECRGTPTQTGHATAHMTNCSPCLLFLQSAVIRWSRTYMARRS